MSKKGGSTTQTTAPDAGTAAWVQQVRNAAGALGNSPGPGVNPASQAAGDFYGKGMASGDLGFRAMSGDPTAVNQLMNPYQKNVIDATNANFAHGLDTTRMSVNSAATSAGAFGGSRYGVALGQAMGDANRAHDQEVAGLNYQGYGDAMNRAGSMANLGFSSANASDQFGQYSRGVAMQTDPNQWRLSSLMQANGLPGTTSSTGTQQNGKSVLGGALGGASAGAAFGPWGAGIGAGVGGLLSLFG